MQKNPTHKGTRGLIIEQRTTITKYCTACHYTSATFTVRRFEIEIFQPCIYDHTGTGQQGTYKGV